MVCLFNIELTVVNGLHQKLHGEVCTGRGLRCMVVDRQGQGAD